jgi:hypothetical protein
MLSARTTRPAENFLNLTWPPSIHTRTFSPDGLRDKPCGLVLITTE